MEVFDAKNIAELSRLTGIHKSTIYNWRERGTIPVQEVYRLCTDEQFFYVMTGRYPEYAPPPQPRAAEPEAGYHDTRIEELERELLVARTEAQTLRVINQQLIDGLAKPAAAPRHHHTRTAADEATR